MEAFDLVIVGGGVAGGALAAALAREDGDARVLLVEQSSKAGQINRGDLLWQPHLELLEQWGVLPEIQRRGAVPVRHNELYDNAGRLLLRHDYGFYRSRFDHGLSLNHPEIEEALLSAAARSPNLTVWRSARFAGITWRDTTAQFSGPEGFLGIFLLNGPDSRVVISLPSGGFPAFMQLPEAERRQAFVRRAPQLRDVPIHWEQVHCYKLYEHHAPAYQQGRVILLGDAAHSFTPMLGMGMNLALEDAAALAPLLAHSARRNALDESVLRREYEGRRRSRNQRVLRESTRQGAFQVAGTRLHHAIFRALCKLYGWSPALREAGFRQLFT